MARYAGLVGALLLAVAGYLGGALPDAGTGSDGGPLTVTSWLLGTTAMVGAWWALRAGAPSTRWAYVTAGSWALPLLVTAPLGSRDVYSYACQGWIYADGGDPYAIGVAAAGCPWAEAVAPVWRDTPAPYGPLFVLLAALAVVLGGGLIGTVVLLRLLALAGVLAAAACLPGLARAAGVPPRRATWLLLACPLVGVHLVAGAHNDAVMLGLLLPALLILVHRPGRLGSLLLADPPGRLGSLRPVGVLLLAGVLLGLAVSVKATAVVVLPFAALAAVRGRPGVRTLLRDGGLLAVGAVGGLLVLSLLTGLGLGWLGGLGRSGDTVQWTSPPTAIGMLIDYVGELFARHPNAVPLTRTAGLALLAVLLLLLFHHTYRTLRPPPPPTAPRPDALIMRLAAPVSACRDANLMINASEAAGWRWRVVLGGAGVGLVATVVLAPVFHPWYATWPLAVLAVAATRTTWFVLPCALASFLALPDGTSLARLTKAPGAIAMTALVLAALVWALFRRQAWRSPALVVGAAPPPGPPPSRD
ncbi:polyprenol phosphomannose-dependent alpha 1,6 mannosyltransferase MptB [Verrucosispora sp. WMMA2121]|uniref:polyprenol phosphomannose-dependent alpha 1,6 mannosyltransferase MptB n=1 Tax=Verrucosispora sp. WMMA2121 TaxID=3015164 RepID=UPI0022B613D0|nr:polyprenol phosphomannose-dependent alpha 1,6 mannosyltransferase MptB [Verrucosispora sp. WMMA2121]MCZ7418243.1 polyprenol phosphomannose-dependent alpha 1,6 mannosyltransferase MptB [Verrucosispora sp. WMMA2121]